ncbi:MAG: hypothetical protein ACE5DR_05940 [Thermodesulfobacteriota bacterium]
MKRQNIIYIEGETMQAVRAAKGRDRVMVDDTQSFASDKLEEYLRGSNERVYTLVVNFKKYFRETITVPSVSRRHMGRVISSEISRQSPFSEFSYIYTLSKEKAKSNKKTRDVHVFAVDMEELQEVIMRFSACGISVQAIYPDLYAVKFLLEDRASGLGLFNAGKEQKMFLVNHGELLFERTVECGDEDPLSAETRNIYLSINYCQQTLRVKPERLFLIGDACRLSGIEALTVPAVSSLKPGGLEVSEEVFQKFALPLSALYAGKAIDISPRSLRVEHLREGVQTYGAAAFCALSIIGLIFLGFTVDKAGASSERLAMQRNQLFRMYGVQSSYMKTLNLYGKYRIFLENGGKDPFSRLFLNLSDLNRPGVSIEKLSASAGEGGVILTLKGLIEAESLSDTQARYDGLLEYIKGPAAMTIDASELKLMDGSFTLTASRI